MGAPFQVMIDERATEKLAENDVTENEVHEVFAGSWRQAMSRSTTRPVAFGRTSANRLIAVVFEVELTDPLTFSVVTAYEPSQDETTSTRPTRRKGTPRPRRRLK